jgi:acyl-CoA synthetase (AMP-forming)/AMP-acid ligase II
MGPASTQCIRANKFNQVGIGRNDRVALVLPNSAEMASSFVTVACCCTSAPLNPSYRADEFEFHLNDLNAKALVVETGSTSPAVAVATKMGIARIEIEPDPVGRWYFYFEHEWPGAQGRTKSWRGAS